MSLDRWSSVETLRQPEYTGTNRCIPCTIVNCCIAAVLAAIVFLASPIVGAITFGLSLALVYFRGYLVPGTPMLTKRYFPVQLLRLFSKDPGIHRCRGVQGEQAGSDETSPAAGDRNRSVLERTGVLVECPETDDVCLDEAFRESWRETISAIRGDKRQHRSLLAGALAADIEPSVIAFEEGAHKVRATADRVTVGEWPSRVALVADLAAAKVLAEYDPSWTKTKVRARGAALARLRIFLETCPTCDAPVDFHEEGGSACCWSREVITVRCTGCDARLLEVDELSFDDGSTAYL